MTPIQDQLAEHLEVVASAQDLLAQASDIAKRLCEAFENGGTLYSLGNGGSAADAQHLAGELIGHYRHDRRPLPAVALSPDGVVSSCIANDYRFEDVFARQIEALAGPRDVVVAFSTSGRSRNVVDALETARRKGAITVLMTGNSSAVDEHVADVVVRVASSNTARIQEVHVMLLHMISEIVDDWALMGDRSIGAVGAALEPQPTSTR
ncbi:D-sedoheptulose-7-phosphate isomerase [Microbacterium lacus]|uniref:SIS domain-containing protein n=1 Tax=Microbacterium lacus TaxID=415217 RepID=A0ABN2FXD5_9MICO